MTEMQPVATGHTSTSEVVRLSDIVERLAAMYPKQFSGDAGTAWADEFRRALKHLPESKLRAAWSGVFRNWTKATCPMPAHFLEHVPKDAAGVDGSGYDWDGIKSRTAELVDLELSRRAEAVETAKAEGWLFDLRDHFRSLAWAYAQFEQHEHPDPLAAACKRLGRPLGWLNEDDIAEFRARASSRHEMPMSRVVRQAAPEIPID